MEDNSIYYFNTVMVNNFREEVISALTKAINKKRLISNGWNLFDMDVSKVFSVTKSINIKKGFKIGIYCFKYDGGAQTHLFGLPEDVVCPDPCENDKKQFKDVMPDGAIDIMSVIEGDLSPWSYVEASILYRELSSICNGWHNVHWGVEKILDGMPEKNPSSYSSSDPEKKEWRSFYTPTDWRPLIITNEIYSHLQFYSYSGLYRETIFRNVDTFNTSKTDDIFGYRRGEYLFSTERSPIAFGDPGVCW